MHAKYGSRELASSGGGGSLLKGVSNRICRFRPSSSCSTTPLARLQLTFPGQHPAIRKRASPVLPLGLHLAKCATPFCAHCNVINCHPVHNPTLLLHSAHFTLYPFLYRTPLLLDNPPHLFRFAVFEASSPLSIRRDKPRQFIAHHHPRKR